MACTWERKDGRWRCTAQKCTHWTENGCSLGKVSLTCDDNSCLYNRSVAPGVYACSSMDIHLDAEGHCLGKRQKY